MKLFITGTDTGVGKTHVTALLLAELRRRGLPAAGFKPGCVWTPACGKPGQSAPSPRTAHPLAAAARPSCKHRHCCFVAGAARRLL